MSTETVIKCDRCGFTVKNQKKAGRIYRSGKDNNERFSGGEWFDLCELCAHALDLYLSKSNVNSPGYPPPGYTESCPHHVPCAGPCSSAQLVRL